MADIGYISLLLALAFSLYAAAASVLGKLRDYPELMASGRRAAYAVGGLLTVASGALVYALVTRDFHLTYVAAYTSSDLPLTYTISAFYAGNEGSLLFWAWTLAIFTIVVLVQNRRTHPELMPYVIATTMLTEAFFVVLMAFISNPFQYSPFAPPEGRGLNPLLENPGMLFHPPTLLAGYVGFTIPFAFAMAALATNRLGSEWLQSTRRWTLFAWLVLGIGNLLGAQWAYVELGWGGYWAWDPVENAGLLPWLTGTAFLHSTMIQKRRGMLKVWNLVLIILTFTLSIFGTFLTRSGVLSSVHTFGQSALGPFFILFMGSALVFSLALLFYRLPDLKSEEELDSFVSRESSFLFNNLILLGAAFAIFWGTVFPLVSEAVRGVKVTVGPPFFNQVNGPIFLALILLMGVCPLLGWRRASPDNLLRNFLYPVGAALLLGLVLFLLGVRETYALLAFVVCGFVIATILLEWFRGVKARRHTQKENYFQAFYRLLLANRPRYGGYIVHLAIILIALGVAGSTFYKVEKEASLEPGQTVTLKDYTLKYEGLSQYATASREVVSASLSVSSGERFLGTLTSEKYFHRSYEQAVTEVAIYSTLKEDLYVILAGWTGNSATFQLLVNPLVVWIWIGAVVLIAGTTFAVWPGGRSGGEITPRER